MWWLIGFPGFVAVLLAGLVLFSAYTARRVEREVPPLGRFVEVDGARLHYVDQGSGPVIVMIHGLAGQMRNFTHSLVGRLTDQFRVIVLDRPGSGYSTRGRGASARLRPQADTVARFIAALQLERPLVVGHSLGGALALALAIDHPEAVGGLALVAPLTHPQDSVPEAFKGLAIRSIVLRRFIAWTLAVPSAILMGHKALESVFGPERPPADFATAGGGALWLRPTSFTNASADLMACADDLPYMLERYGALKVPAGILFGTRDQILDHRAHGVAMRQRLPELNLQLIDGGHMLPITQPEATAAFVRGMASRATRSSTTGHAAGAR